VFIAAAFIAGREPKSGALALALFTGKAISAGHLLPPMLGDGVFSVPHHPWLYEGPFGALGTYAVWRVGGYPALAFASVCLVAITFFLIAERCRLRGLGSSASLVAMGIAFLCSLDALHVGGGLTDLAFTAALFLCLDRAPRTAALWTVPLTLVWSNVSVYGCIAPLWSLLAAFGRSFGTTARERAVSAIAYVLPVAAIMGTPGFLDVFKRYGDYLHLHMGTSLQTPEAAHVGTADLYYGFIPTILLTAWIGLRRSGLSDTLTALAAIVLVLINGEYLDMAGVVLGPIVATSLFRVYSHEWARVSKNFLKIAENTYVFCGVICITALLCACITGLRGKMVMDSQREQMKAIDRLAADGKEHRLFCATTSWCNDVLFRDAKNVKIFLDGRSLSYPQKIYEDAYDIVQIDPSWHKKIDAWRITDVLTARNRLASMLELLPNWRCVSYAKKISACERER
jgi:hypothetical protein